MAKQLAVLLAIVGGNGRRPKTYWRQDSLLSLLYPIPARERIDIGTRPYVVPVEAISITTDIEAIPIQMSPLLDWRELVVRVSPPIEAVGINTSPYIYWREAVIRLKPSEIVSVSTFVSIAKHQVIRQQEAESIAITTSVLLERTPV